MREAPVQTVMTAAWAALVWLTRLVTFNAGAPPRPPTPVLGGPWRFDPPAWSLRARPRRPRPLADLLAAEAARRGSPPTSQADRAASGD